MLQKILLFLAAAFFVWAALSSVGLPHEPWLVPGGLAAWVISLLIPDSLPLPAAMRPAEHKGAV